jgi:hypothetical protein
MTFQSAFYIPYAGKDTVIYCHELAHLWTKVTKMKMTQACSCRLRPTMNVISLVVNNYASKRIERLGGNL